MHELRLPSRPSNLIDEGHNCYRRTFVELTAEVGPENQVCYLNRQVVLTRGRRVVAMTLLLAALNVPDLWATVKVYEAGTLFEANPLARYVLDSHGVVGISI